MNGARKYVVSNTLSEATWENSSVINGDVYASLAALKKDTGLSTTGSATLVRWLLEQGLVDELHLLVHPSSSATARSCSPTVKPCRSS
jgi:dihydrofolate reductase